MKTLRLLALLSFFTLAACGGGNSVVGVGEDSGVDSGSITVDGGQRDASNDDAATEDDAAIDDDAGDDDASTEGDGGFVDDDGGFVDEDADIEPLDDASIAIDMNVVVPMDLGVIEADAGRDLGVIEADAGRDLGVIGLDAEVDLGVVTRDLGVVERDADVVVDATIGRDADVVLAVCEEGIWLDSAADLATYEPCVTTTSLYVDAAFDGASVYLPNLEVITGDVVMIEAIEFEEIDLPALREVDGSIVLRELLVTRVDLPRLSRVGQALEIEQLIVLPSLSFPALVTIEGDGMAITNNDELTSVKFELLESVGSVQISTDPLLDTFSVPALTRIRGYFGLYGTSIVELDLSQVVDVAFGFTVYESLSLRTLALDSLLSVGDDFYLQSNARLRSVRAPGLARVAGSVKAYDNDLCEFPPESQIACEGYAVSLRTVCP
jgi:hypothetical protein